MKERIGYCTNVHSGATLEQTKQQLDQHAVRVRELLSPTETLGVGLWLSAETASDLRHRAGVQPFKEWLQNRGLRTMTVNGFPHGDFHGPTVKHRVYHPTWCDEARLEFTVDLIHLLPELLISRQAASISTLPIDWGFPPPSSQNLKHAAALLVRAAEEMEQVENETGKQLILALEPEPGCCLSTSSDLVQFFEKFLLPAGPDDLIYRYLGVCHDVCHAVVMFESQAEALQRYRVAGIRIAKVQVSSGILCNLDALDVEARSEALRQLQGCHETRYLHQACYQSEPGAPISFYQDLPEAMASADALNRHGKWAVHFHVPVHVREFGLLEASQSAILDCLVALGKDREDMDFEVETYAWNVLPQELAVENLAAGIASELRWFESTLASFEESP